MKPENNPELAEAITAMLKEAGRVNELAREGKMRTLSNCLFRIQKHAFQAEMCISEMGDLV